MGNSLEYQSRLAGAPIFFGPSPRVLLFKWNWLYQTLAMNRSPKRPALEFAARCMPGKPGQALNHTVAPRNIRGAQIKTVQEFDK